VAYVCFPRTPEELSSFSYMLPLSAASPFSILHSFCRCPVFSAMSRECPPHIARSFFPLVCAGFFFEWRSLFARQKDRLTMPRSFFSFSTHLSPSLPFSRAPFSFNRITFAPLERIFHIGVDPAALTFLALKPSDPATGAFSLFSRDLNRNFSLSPPRTPVCFLPFEFFAPIQILG